MRDTLVMLLAGGMGSRLNVLAQKRAKPAVPFAGSNRIIDFTLANASRSGLWRVGVLTQYRPFSLTSHLGNGMAWDLWGKERALRILPPFKGQKDHDWYRGTSDAVYQNLQFIRKYDPRRVLILSGDHVYRMDYGKMIRFHCDRGAELTIATMSVPWDEACRYGLLEVDAEHRVIDFQEKPAVPRSNLASMGIYIFESDVLERALEDCCEAGEFDFGQAVIPHVHRGRHKPATGADEGGRVFAYPFNGYWRDVGTIHSYWEANMDALDPESGLDLQSWGIRTNTEVDGLDELPPLRIGHAAGVRRALLGRGGVIEGTVEHSVLSPGVEVARGAVVRDSIVMHGTTIAEGAVVDHAIIDKGARIGAGARVGVGAEGARPNHDFPTHLDSGLSLVGKGATVPDGAEIGRNCLVFPGVEARQWASLRLAAGATLWGEEGGP